MAYDNILKQIASSPSEDEAGGFYFKNTETIRDKTRNALKEGLAGNMIWELSMDTNDDASLVKAIDVERRRDSAE